MNHHSINTFTKHNSPQSLKPHTQLSALALLIGLSFGQAQASTTLSLTEAEGGNLWFVELTSQPVASGNSKKNVQSAKAAFRKAVAEAGVSFKERRAFDTLFNGFSVEIKPAERAKLMQIDGVKAIYPVEVIKAPSVDVINSGIIADMSTALAMTGADIAQNSLGLDGSGIKVAVMDTGIDIDHPDFGGSGANGTTPFPSARVQYGYDFVGDAFNADSTSATYNPITSPDNNPDDCGGHGTHVAGIVGANGTVKGVAPAVTFGAYRVFGCNGSTTADVMIAAMEQAYADGMHVLNMSIGSAFQWPQYPTAQAADRLVGKGMVVVASIGNSGTSGLYSAGAPGLGKDVIGVASFDNSHVLQAIASVNGEDIGYAAMTFSPPIPLAGEGPVVSIGEACAPLAAGSLTGKIALAARGICTFGIKATNAINAGADAVLISNNVAGALVNVTLGAPIPNGKPVVGISLADGNKIRAMTDPILTWTDRSDIFPSATGGLISSFSSYGLSPDLALKPDIGAPGGAIYSTYPLESGAFATLGGTSMSSPHVAGSVALLLQAKPGTEPGMVRDILQNSADPKNWQGGPGLGLLDQVHRQGAGMLDISGSVQATTLVTPGKIATGEGEAGPYTQRLTIHNDAAAAVTYQMGSVNALSTSGVVTLGVALSDATVTFSSTSVEVPAGGSATVDVTITPATGPVYGQYGGYVVLTPTGEGQVYRVPFAGFVGDYQTIPTVTPTSNGFPWLAKLNGGLLSKCFADCSFTMEGDDMPFFLIHFEHQAQYMEMNILHAGNMMPVHPVFHKTNVEEYLPRNSTATGFFSFAWDGSRIHSNGGKGKVKTVPNGSYVIELKVLKALGDPANANHWDTWTSPVINVQRP